MSHARRARSASMLLTLAFTAVGCGSNPTGVPYVSLGRDLAGVYNPTDTSSGANVRIVLGTRHTVSGRYDNASGQEVRFYGTWEHRRDGRLVLSFDGAPGLPTDAVLEVSQETLVQDITPEGMPGLPQPDPLFRTQDIVKLRGQILIEGTPVELDLFRVAVTFGGGEGGQTAN
jgi:hypothetical protein